MNQYTDSSHFPKGNYSLEAGEELQVKEREPSIESASLGEQDKKPELDTNNLLEQILERENLNNAYLRVCGNNGAAGMDGLEVDELLPFLKQHGASLKQQLQTGSYRPQPVRRVEIPKPEGGVRLLGIPTVVDRMIQQAISQILTPLYEEVFSENSYGFRPGRNAHQAVKQAQIYINSGYKIVVDIDLEKFFDRVNRDKLMHLLSLKISDKRVLRLIRRYLESGVMVGGIVSATEEGTPQGGPLSPLLSNVMLNELDKELEKRGHKFCRYADDCNIYVKSKRGGERVMESVSRYIEKHLKLKVNTIKSSVDYPSRRKFLGFSFYRNKEGIRLRIHPKPIDRFRMKVRKLTSRSNGKSMEERYEKLNNLLVGWLSYFRIADM